MSYFGKVQMEATDGTDLTGDTQGLHVVARRDLQRISVASAGLTTATNAYIAGDQLGTEFTFANAARVSGGTGTIVGCTVTSVADITGAMDLLVTRSSISLAGDNAAFAISDDDVLKVVGLVPMMASWDLGNNRICQAFNLAIPYDCSGGTSLYGSLIARTGHTYFTNVTDLQVTLWVERN